MPTRPPYTQRLAFKELDGHQVHLEVWLPSDEQRKGSSEGVPVVVWVHGGGFFDGAAGDASDANLLPTLERGWAFASVEYRQVPQVTLDDAIKDVQDACEWIRSGKLDEALGGEKVDGQRLAITGASAGGALAVFSAYTLDPPPKVVYSLYGSLDLLHPSYNAPVNFPSGHITYDSVSSHLSPTGSVVSHSPADVDFSTMIANGRTRACFWAVQEGRVLPLATRAKEPVDLANPPSELLKYRATYLVDQADEPKRQIPPTVCVHGKDDLMVPAALSQELVERLKAVGVESEYIEAPGKNHGFDLVPGVLDDVEAKRVFDAANDFVARFI